VLSEDGGVVQPGHERREPLEGALGRQRLAHQPLVLEADDEHYAGTRPFPPTKWPGGLLGEAVVAPDVAAERRMRSSLDQHDRRLGEQGGNPNRRVRTVKSTLLGGVAQLVRAAES